MPIYAYRCEDCGHTKDMLQKLSDEPLTECPSCGQANFKKQLTSAGIQTGGSGGSNMPSPCMSCPMSYGGPCG